MLWPKHVGENFIYMNCCSNLKTNAHVCVHYTGVYSFIPQSVTWQVHSLFQNEFSTQWNPDLVFLLCLFSLIFEWTQNLTFIYFSPIFVSYRMRYCVISGSSERPLHSQNLRFSIYSALKSNTANQIISLL
jgi:hypothetical protein